MKKIIAIITLSLAFSFNSNAQEVSKTKSEIETKEELTKKNILKDVEDLDKTVKLNESLKRDYITLLNMREEALNGSKLEEERKVIFNKFNYKILGGLTPEQLELLKKNNTLYKKLTQYQNN